MDSQGSPVSRRVVGPNSCPGSFVGKLASEYLGGTREDVEPVTETGQSCIKGRGLGGCLATARLRRTTGLELHSSGSVDVNGRSQTEKQASHVAVQVAVCIGVSPEGRSIFCNSRLFWVHQHQRPPRKSGIPAEGAERQGSKAPLSIAAECGTPSGSASGVGHAKGPLLPASQCLGPRHLSWVFLESPEVFLKLPNQENIFESGIVRLDPSVTKKGLVQSCHNGLFARAL